MGCTASLEVDADGRRKCAARVERRLLVFIPHQNTSWRGQPMPGTHYQIEIDIEFNKRDDLRGYRVLRPMQCPMELAKAVSKKMESVKYHDW